MNDIFLMTRWAEKGASEVTRFNICRLYMDIRSLAEMLSGDGKHIMKYLFEGDKSVLCNSII
jgi:hypothetical protein